jgi:hypothetical protein
VRIGEFRIERDGAVEALQRLAVAAELVIGSAQHVMDARLWRPERQRTLGELDALLELAVLHGDDRHVVQRVGVAGIVLQHLDVALHGAGEVALAVQGERGFQRFGDGR